MILDRNDHNSMHGLKLNAIKVNSLVSGNMYSGVAKLCHDSCTTGICRSTCRSAITQYRFTVLNEFSERMCTQL